MKKQFFFYVHCKLQQLKVERKRTKTTTRKKKGRNGGRRGEKSKAGKEKKRMKEFSQKTELYIKEQKRALRRM